MFQHQSLPQGPFPSINAYPAPCLPLTHQSASISTVLFIYLLNKILIVVYSTVIDRVLIKYTFYYLSAAPPPLS